MPFKKWPTYCKPKVLAIGRVSVLSEYSVTSRAKTMKGPSRERCYGAPNNFNGSSRCILVDGCRLNIGTMEIAYIFFRRCTYKPVSSGHHSGFHCHVCWKEGMTQVLFSRNLKPEKNKHMPVKMAVSDFVFLFFAMSLFYAYPCKSCFMDEWGFSKLESKFKGRKTAVIFSIVTTRDTK